MKKTVTVEICTGTTCFVMGAGHLLNLPDELPEELKDLVDIRGTHCLGVCNNPANGIPPFARVGQTLMSDVSAESIIKACFRILNSEDGNEPV